MFKINNEFTDIQICRKNVKQFLTLLSVVYTRIIQIEISQISQHPGNLPDETSKFLLNRIPFVFKSNR